MHVGSNRMFIARNVISMRLLFLSHIIKFIPRSTLVNIYSWSLPVIFSMVSYQLLTMSLSSLLYHWIRQPSTFTKCWTFKAIDQSWDNLWWRENTHLVTNSFSSSTIPISIHPMKTKANTDILNPNPKFSACSFAETEPTCYTSVSRDPRWLTWNRWRIHDITSQYGSPPKKKIWLKINGHKTKRW